jgi:hypothetical protein
MSQERVNLENPERAIHLGPNLVSNDRIRSDKLNDNSNHLMLYGILELRSTRDIQQIFSDHQVATSMMV